MKDHKETGKHDRYLILKIVLIIMAFTSLFVISTASFSAKHIEGVQMARGSITI